MSIYTQGWFPLGNIFYRKNELYLMGWADQVDLKDYVVAAAQFGGPIALIRDPKKIQRVHVGGKPFIYIFSSSGQSISSFQFEQWSLGRLIHIDWSSSEELLCIQEEGRVSTYDIFGKQLSTYQLDQEICDTKIIDCKVFTHHTTGIAVLTGSYRFFLYYNIKDPKVRRLPEVPGLDSPPTSWCVISEKEFRETKLLVARDAKLYILEPNEKTCTQIAHPFTSPINAITEMAVSFDSKNLVLLSDTGMLWMGTSDFEKKFCEYETQTSTRPQYLLWCGDSAVAGLWENILLIVGPEKDWITYMLDIPVHLVPEIDGLRIITNTNHEIVQRVPDVTASIFRIGSLDPGALLLEASKEFQKQSHKANEYIKMIQENDQLELAVKQCIQAAGHELTPSTQKMLLRAASFGKQFVPGMDPEPFVKMCKTLRVLNAVQYHTVGIPITYNQLKCLSMMVLLDRLVLRRHYCLAIRIAKYLKIPDAKGASRILAHWACYKVEQSNLDQEQVAQEIADKLGHTPGISYSEIANKAVDRGRKQLAVKLLDYEPRASEQVPLLLKLKQYPQALSRAIESGDTDLMYHVIFHLRRTLPVQEFSMMIRNFPVAYKLYQKLCKEQDIEKLRNMFYEEDNFIAEADCRVIASYQETRKDERISSLQAALEGYRRGKDDFAAIHTEEQIRLMKYQIKLEEKFNQPYLDMSLHQTIRILLMDKEYKLADELRKDFKVPDRRFWWLKILVLAENGDWMELDKFARSKKSPVGYEPFVDVCLKYNNKYESHKYLAKVKEENRVKYCIKLGMLDEAAKTAFDQKSEAALRMVLNKCGATNRILQDKINGMLSQLKSHR